MPRRSSRGSPTSGALLAASCRHDVLEVSHTVELGSVPTELLLQSKATIDHLARELQLAGAGPRAAPGAGPAVQAELAGLVRTYAPR